MICSGAANPGSFTKNVMLVFAGTFFGSFLNLLYQLIIAHHLSAVDFASFNSLIAIFMMFSAPIGTVQAAVAKYTSEFSAKNETEKIKVLISCLFKKALILGLITLVVFYFLGIFAINRLHIQSNTSAYTLALMLAFCWLIPVFSGGMQGLELFKWFIFVGISGSMLKLIFTFVFLNLGFNVPGALAAFLFSLVITFIFSFIPLRREVDLGIANNCIKFNELFLYLIPVMISNFCYLNLVSFDMVLVKYFFSPQESGIYSLGQMVGKIFLFLPGAISIAMFPRVSYLNARNSCTRSTLKQSLIYGFILSAAAIAVYNLMPGFILKILTGKSSADAVALGRVFSFSMSFFALLFIFISYFLSLKDFRFLKYIIFFTLFQIFEISIFHPTIFKVQFMVLFNAISLFIIHALLARRVVKQ